MTARGLMATLLRYLSLTFLNPFSLPPSFFPPSLPSFPPSFPPPLPPSLPPSQVLGLMCDGQFSLMQNYLREQKDNIVTINLVGEVALFAQVNYQYQ